MSDKKLSTEGEDVIATLRCLLLVVMLIAIGIAAVRIGWEILTGLFRQSNTG